MKKILLGIGALGAIVVPIVSVVACSIDTKQEKKVKLFKFPKLSDPTSYDGIVNIYEVDGFNRRNNDLCLFVNGDEIVISLTTVGENKINEFIAEYEKINS